MSSLYFCSASGTLPSGRPWSVRIGHLSSASAATVESAWNAQFTSAWTNGSHGIETLFPTALTVDLLRTDQVSVFSIGGVNKLRVVAQAQDIVTLAGTSSNAGLPDQNVVLVSLRSATPGKEGRGRVHFSCVDETLVTAGELGSTPTTRVSTAMEALRSGMASSAHQPVLITEKLTKLGTAVGTTKDLTSVQTDRVIRTLRGRVKSRVAVYL